MLVLQLHPGAIPVPERVEDERGNDRRRIDHRLTRQHVAKRLVLRHDQPGDRREIEREHERNDIKAEQDEEQTPVLHSEEEQYGTAERVIDMKRAGEAERPHDEQLAKQDRENQHNAAGMIAEAMEARDEQRNRQHQQVIGVDEDQPMKIMQAIDDQVRQCRCRHRKCRDVDATLALDHPFVTRNDPDGYQAVKPRRELNGGRPLAPNEVAQPCHRARLGDVLHDHSIASFGATSQTVTAITAAGINSPHL